jgi:hypothetical protein
MMPAAARTRPRQGYVGQDMRALPEGCGPFGWLRAVNARVYRGKGIL